MDDIKWNLFKQVQSSLASLLGLCDLLVCDLQVYLQVFGDLNGASKSKLETRLLLAAIISPLS